MPVVNYLLCVFALFGAVYVLGTVLAIPSCSPSKRVDVLLAGAGLLYMCMDVPVSWHAHERECMWVCVSYECGSSLLITDGLVPYLTLHDPVLVCWHPLFSSCLEQTHVVRAVRKWRQGEKKSTLCVHVRRVNRITYFWFFFLVHREISDILCLTLTCL